MQQIISVNPRHLRIIFSSAKENLMTNALFICSQNKLRSPTAEHVFAKWGDFSAS
jgi:hypothetical protein